MVPISNNLNAETRRTQAWDLGPPPPDSSKLDEETAYHLAPPLLGYTPPEQLGPVGSEPEQWAQIHSQIRMQYLAEIHSLRPTYFRDDQQPLLEVADQAAYSDAAKEETRVSVSTQLPLLDTGVEAMPPDCMGNHSFWSRGNPQCFQASDETAGLGLKVGHSAEILQDQSHEPPGAVVIEPGVKVPQDQEAEPLGAVGVEPGVNIPQDQEAEPPGAVGVEPGVNVPQDQEAEPSFSFLPDEMRQAADQGPVRGAAQAPGLASNSLGSTAATVETEPALQEDQASMDQGIKPEVIIRHIDRKKGAKQGFFITGHILDHGVQCLLDTGSMVTLLSKDVWERFPVDERPDLEEAPCKVTGVSGTPVPLEGIVAMPLVVGSQIFLQPMLVADIEEEVILGYDFMNLRDVVLDVPRHVLRVNGEQIPMWTSQDPEQRLRVVVARRITLLPNSQVVATAQLKYTSNISPWGLVEPMPGLLEKYGVLVGKALVDTRQHEVPVQVLNPTGEKVVLHPCQTIAFCFSTDGEPVEWVEEPKECRRLHTGIEPELPPHVKELYDESIALLTEEEQHKLLVELSNRGPILAKHKKDYGRTQKVQHGVELTGQPRKQRPKRQPLALQPVEEQEIQNMLDQDIIEPSNSPIASPVVLVKKSDGSYRFCVDYRDLNLHTRKDAYPLPRIEDCLDSLAGARWFCTLDLCSGYWQVELKEEDRYKTAFCTRSGLYQFKVMSFGLCNAPATFERLMETILRGLQWRECLVYLDDIIIFGKTFDETLSRLSHVFDRIQDANLKLNPSKCSLFREEVAFLGHVVSPHGVHTDPSKIEAVVDWPTPKNVREVRSFLGLASYYRKFVKGFAAIARPLHQLTGKGVTFTWGDEAQAAFDQLKVALSTAPILAYPQPEGQIILDTDASGDATGAVLSQIQDGEERVLGYFSSALSGTEQNYCVTRKELLAVVRAVNRFHPYVWGRPVILRTDNAAVLWMKRLKQPSGQMARWLSDVDRYDLHIEHRPGRVHWNADALSRRPCTQCGNEEGLCDAEVSSFPCRLADFPVSWGEYPCNSLMTAENTAFCDVYDTALDTIWEEEESTEDLQPPQPCFVLTRAQQRRQDQEQVENQAWMEGWTPAELREEQLADPEIGPIMRAVMDGPNKPAWQVVAPLCEGAKTMWCQWDRLKLDRGVLHRRWENRNGTVSTWQIVVPMPRRQEVIQFHHGSHLGGHFDSAKTTMRLKQLFFWPRLRESVQDFCRACDQCVARKTTRKPRAPLKRYLVGMPHERVSLDLMGPLNESERGNRFVVVISDHFTKWTESLALPDITAETVARAFVEEWVCRYGPPRFIHSDQGRQFEAELFQEMCRLLGLTKTRTSALHPEGNGQVERFNRTLGAMMSIYVDNHPRDWDDHLPFIMAAYRATQHSSTKLSPNMMLFGRENALPLHVVLGDPNRNDDIPGPEDYVQMLRQRLILAHEVAREHLEKSAATQKHHYDHRAKQVQYRVGDAVWLYNPQRKKGISPKLTAPWVKGFVIITKLDDVTYRVKAGPQNKPLVVHANRLMPYRGPDRPNWFRP